MTNIWNNQRVDLVANYIAEEYKIHLDSGDKWEGKVLNHSEYKKRLQYSFDSFPDINFEITSTIEEENHVAVTWIMTGTNLGMIGKYPPTTKKIRANGMTFYFFDGNLITGHSQVFDRTTVTKQLGFG